MKQVQNDFIAWLVKATHREQRPANILLVKFCPQTSLGKKKLAKAMIERGAAIEVQGNAGPRKKQKPSARKPLQKNKGALCQDQ